MARFECDRCGACCKGTLIVEADDIDVMRQPRLVEADPHYAGQKAGEVIKRLQNEVGRNLLLACGTIRPCPFLGSENLCSIYPTRPNACVMMQAGDEQCQNARREVGLPELRPLDSDD